MSIPETTDRHDDRRPFDLRVSGFLDRRWGWDRLPLPLSLLTLRGLRESLRRENLVDPEARKVAWGPEPPVRGAPRARSIDGAGTDPRDPNMGRAGAIFGRNVPVADTDVHDVHAPNPRDISNRLLARRAFIPATSVNLLTAAWVQFEVHDWMSHGPNAEDAPIEVAVEASDPFPDKPMPIRRTRRAERVNPPTYRNKQSHWWDASQVYGSTREVARAMRTWKGGHLQPAFPYDPPNADHLPEELVPLKGSWWAGLAMFHTLFMREHNAICDHLAETYKDADDQWLYDKARLVVAALIAKIHTVEWTPAMLADRRTEWALRANWSGLFGRRVRDRFGGRLMSGEAFGGIPGSGLSHHGVPYALTEEFLAVYRLHPMIPDDVEIRSSRTGDVLDAATFGDLAGRHAHEALDRYGMTNLFYSFGLANPGQVTLHNYPDQLRHFEHPDGCLDLASIDIVRDRERGVPRYNDFRRRLRLPPVTRFQDFSDDADVVATLRDIYRNPEMVDLMVGLYAEKKPHGFAISDTAFRIFILMASRRLKSDRFFTDDFGPELYTEQGMRWIDENSLASILRRHHPELRSQLRGVDNAFKPWNTPSDRVRRRWWSGLNWGWNQLAAGKFAAVEPVPVPEPKGDDAVVAVPFTERFPDIPIRGLVVADHFPEDELDDQVLKLVGGEEWLARRLPPAARGLPSIAADPMAALEAALPAGHQRLYRTPSRPAGYDPLDLGVLAVDSPFAYLLEGRGDGRFEWDLTMLGRFDCHAGLRSPHATVTFELDDDQLRATSIDCELGRCGVDDPDWDAAQRLALCAAATHLTVVRHFTWIHLVGGERFALATNQHLPKDHPVRRLLQPHVFATHFGNRIVTPIQLAPGGDFERLFSYTHRGLCGLIETAAADFDLEAMDPDRDVERRRLTEPALVKSNAMTNRRDLNELIRNHVSRYLRCYYDDEAIAGDEPLARWLAALTPVRGVSRLGGDTLTLRGAADLMAALIYMVTVDHEIVDSNVWDYLLWSDVVTPRVHRNGRRLPIDVYQRLVNANFILNVDRTTLMTDFSDLALDGKGAVAFTQFREDLMALQRTMDRDEPSTWRIEPRNLKANMNY